MKQFTISKKMRRFLLLLILAAAAAAVLTIDVSIKQGVDGRVREIHMPLYAKGAEFLTRHLEYIRLAKDVTAGCSTDEQKVLAILKWTRENIKEIPPGMPVIDDHILNIIIRGYGVQEQFQDVFTTLCAYSGVPAFWGRVYGEDRKVKYTLSFVTLDKKLRVFDAYYGKYFRNKEGKIASVEDISGDHSIVSGGDVDSIFIKGVPYKTFYYNLDQIEEQMKFRTQKQMPLRRILFEFGKIFDGKKEKR
ncbi:MAG: transglutaminase-like domain-containing protein [Candidatus Omnitrophica bacterium]|nr:transglutaminase-like domain-containing protein [Candidatus Omnitrophota bacterium]